MHEKYREMMHAQSLSPEAEVEFCKKLYATQKSQPVMRKVLIAAVCVCMLVTTVWAADTIFETGVFKLVEQVFRNRPSIRVDINYTTITSKPITDFSQKVQEATEFTQIAYNSWEDAEADLGIALANNSFLSSDRVQMSRNNVLSSLGRVGCYGQFNTMDGQVYCTSVYAFYESDGILIDLQAIATVEHPGVTEEDMKLLHTPSVIYSQKDYKAVAEESYVAASGLPANITKAETRNGETSDFSAFFVANDVSYRIYLYSPGHRQDEEVRALLIDILESFTF